MSESVANSVRIGLIGPDSTQPCGISDYTLRLSKALSTKCELVFCAFNHVFAEIDSKGLKISEPVFKTCKAILVQYEGSLVPDKSFLIRLSREFPQKIFLVPHEVYLNDPFAFPYDQIKSKFLPLLWLKQFRYRLQHQEFNTEKKLQKNAYYAHRVIPLSGPGFKILHALAGEKVLAPIPIAQFIPAVSGIAEQAEEIPTGLSLGKNYFPENVKTVLGIFGFLNPSLDYDMVFDLLNILPDDIAILMLGGSRTGAFSKELLENKIRDRKLETRVKITGFIPESALPSHFEICDLFLSPMISKSNSSSILNLLHLHKVILTPDLPLCQYLKSEGAPLVLYQSPSELAKRLREYHSGQLKPLPNKYPWTFDSVAEAYLQVMLKD